MINRASVEFYNVSRINFIKVYIKITSSLLITSVISTLTLTLTCFPQVSPAPWHAFHKFLPHLDMLSTGFSHTLTCFHCCLTISDVLFTDREQEIRCLRRTQQSYEEESDAMSKQIKELQVCFSSVSRLKDNSVNSIYMSALPLG